MDVLSGILDIFSIVGGLVAIPQGVEYVKRWSARVQRRSQGGTVAAASRVESISERHPRSRDWSEESLESLGCAKFSKGLFTAFPWGLAFASLGEYLLTHVFTLSDSSGLYTLLILLCWAAGLPIGLVARDSSGKVVVWIAGVGWVVAIVVLTVFAFILRV